jgi:hypothetical protein
MTTARFVLSLAILLLFAIAPVGTGASRELTTGEDQISPYWGGAISQWTPWILYWANERALDPDLVAAVIRQESIGRTDAEGPTGAVGLMMVMPAEVSGLSWRPSAEELKEPNLNIRWGTGMLKQIIRDSGGDLFHSLAAYNGGWEQINISATQRYAQKVLTYYAYAIAARHGYSYQESKNWTLVLMTREDRRIKMFQTGTSGPYPVPCFENVLGFRDFFPEMVDAPRALVTRFVDKEGHEVLIDAWLLVGGPDYPLEETLVRAGPSMLSRSGHRP